MKKQKTREDAFNWILENFSVDGAAGRIISNILEYADDLSEEEQVEFMNKMLDGTIGLTEDEIDTLNRLVVIFLETAELRAKSKQETRMAFWKQNVDQIITSNGFPLLTHAGSISHEQMEARTGELYQQFDQGRKWAEALEADQQDEADLKALEATLKKRAKP